MKYLYLVQARDNIFPYKQALIVLFKMSNPNSITRIMTAILLTSTTIAILFGGISDNMNIAYTVDDSGRSIINVSYAQGFNASLNNGYGCDKADGDATWCV